MPMPTEGDSALNKGTIVLVGCALGTGGLFYMSTGAEASRPVTPAATPTLAAPRELAHSATTPKPGASPTAPATEEPTSTATQQPLTLTQVRGLPRPPGFAPSPSSSSGTYIPPSETTAPPNTEVPTGATTPTATPALPISTVTPSAPTPTPRPAPTQHPWPLPVPPTLPPYPDAGTAPRPPTE